MVASDDASSSSLHRHHDQQQQQEHERETFFHKGVLYDALSGEVLRCLFCRICQGLEPGRIQLQDDRYVVFHTIDPATHLHLLVTPRAHITSVKSLRGRQGAQTVREMVRVGEKALGEEHSVDKAKFCFHVPPYTSIDHLHLHVIADHTHSRKYPSHPTWYCKDADVVIAELEQQERDEEKKREAVEEEKKALNEQN